MGELANCPNCNTLFISGIRQICDNCYQQEITALQTVHHFLKKRKNRSAMMLEVVEATGVEEEQLLKFIKEKRINLSDFPNLAYPCEKCGKQITEGKLCYGCTTELQKDLHIQENIDQVKERNMLKENSEATTYFVVDEKKKR